MLTGWIVIDKDLSILTVDCILFWRSKLMISWVSVACMAMQPIFKSSSIVFNVHKNKCYAILYQVLVQLFYSFLIFSSISGAQYHAHLPSALIPTITSTKNSRIRSQTSTSARSGSEQVWSVVVFQIILQNG